MAKLGYDEFRECWADHVDLRQFVRGELIGETLNFPCGQSPLGDVRVDRDPSVNPDIIADLENIPFEEQSFDTVYCDPPYSFFKTDRGLSWAGELYKLASKRLIVQGPGTALHVGAPSEQEIHCLKAKPGSSQRAIKILQVFDRPSNKLSQYD